MFEDLLPYYNEELFNIRELAEEFASSYPKIAGHLKLSKGQIKDPHIERLIQAFAFLNARIRHKLDDDFPEINQAFLNVLYPHYLAPIPSLSIIKFNPLPDLSASYSIERGSKVISSTQYGEPCHFMTCYPVSLWPFDIVETSFKAKPGHLSFDPFPGKNSLASLKIVLKCPEGKPTFSQYDINDLRFFINGTSNEEYILFGLIFTHLVGLVIKGDGEQTFDLPPSHIQPVGFSKEESLIPFSSRTSAAYNLLTDYFIFPEKFLFFDLKGLSKDLLQGFNDTLEIYLYFNLSNSLLERHLFNNNLLLGCTPIINMFKQEADPQKLNHTTSEIRIVPDARRLESIEAYAIVDVKKVSNDFKEENCLPFFGVNHGTDTEQTSFWYSTKRERRSKKGNLNKINDLYLTLIDEQFNPLITEDSFLKVNLICTNSSLPSLLPFDPVRSFLQIEEGNAPVGSINCLTPFTAPIDPPAGHAARWQLISHLSLNHLSLSNSVEGLLSLKEILKLYNFKNTPEIHDIINGISNISIKNCVRRCTDIPGYPICQGLDICLELNEDCFRGTSISLFSNIMDFFFRSYCNINSFTQLSVTTTQQGFLKQWQPQIGNKILI